MKRLVLGILSVMLVLSFNGCSDDKPKESPVKIKVEQAYNEAWNYYYPKIIITSVADKINIENVIVNKGNCKYSNEDIAYVNGQMKAVKLLPKELSYGKQLEIRLKKCEVIKIDVKTNQGDWSVEY